MPVDVSVDEQTGVVVCRPTVGDLTPEEILAAVDEFMSHPCFRKSWNVLWDGRHTEPFGEKTGALQEIVRGMELRREDRGSGYKVAILAPDDVVFGISRQYQAFSDDLPCKVKVFREEDEALSWLTV